MRLPQKAPKIDDLSTDQFKKILSGSTNPEHQLYIQKANAIYRHWDELRYSTPPSDFTAKEAWAAIKFSRISNSKPLPLIDPTGRPFTFWLPETALQALHKVDQGAAGNLIFDGKDQSFFQDAKDQIIISSLMEEAIATSQLEGAVTTRDQAKEMLRSNRKPKNRSEQMILNSYRTIQMLRGTISEPLSIELLNKIQREITINTLESSEEAGRFRTVTDKISVVDGETGQTVYTPPEATLLNERMQKLVDFANTASEGSNFIHPLVKAAILHFWLAYEHPYVDGNGRTARALFYWYMLKHGYWLFEYLTISRVVHLAPTQYYRSFLYSEHDENDLTYSIHFMLRVTNNAIKQLKKYLREKQQENQKLASMLRGYPGLNFRQRGTLSEALKKRQQFYTVANHQAAYGVSYQTARTDLLNLVERGLFVQSLSGKQLIFWAADDLSEKIRQPPTVHEMLSSPRQMRLFTQKKS